MELNEQEDQYLKEDLDLAAGMLQYPKVKDGMVIEEVLQQM